MGSVLLPTCRSNPILYKASAAVSLRIDFSLRWARGREPVQYRLIFRSITVQALANS
ncbi:MAG: hypothetical protein WA842_02055 [Croceibacterium sp.]